MHFLTNEEREKWIVDYIEREPAVARQALEDAETAIALEQGDGWIAANVGWKIWQPEHTFVEMMLAIGDSLSDLASSNNEQDWEDDDEEDTELGQLSDDDEACWVVVGTIFETVQLHMERFRPEMMMVDRLTKPGWGDAADYCRERETKWSMTELRVQAVTILQTDVVAAAATPSTFGEYKENLDIAPEILQMPRRTSRPGSS